MAQSDVKTIGDGLVRNYDKMYFNFKEVAKLTGMNVKTVGNTLLCAGINVSIVGKSKRISAYDIGELMTSKRVEATRTLH